MVSCYLPEQFGALGPCWLVRALFQCMLGGALACALEAFHVIVLVFCLSIGRNRGGASCSRALGCRCGLLLPMRQSRCFMFLCLNGWGRRGLLCRFRLAHRVLVLECFGFVPSGAFVHCVVPWVASGTCYSTMCCAVCLFVALSVVRQVVVVACVLVSFSLSERVCLVVVPYFGLGPSKVDMLSSTSAAISVPQLCTLSSFTGDKSELLIAWSQQRVPLRRSGRGGVGRLVRRGGAASWSEEEIVDHREGPSWLVGSPGLRIPSIYLSADVATARRVATSEEAYVRRDRVCCRDTLPHRDKVGVVEPIPIAMRLSPLLGTPVLGSLLREYSGLRAYSSWQPTRRTLELRGKRGLDSGAESFVELSCLGWDAEVVEFRSWVPVRSGTSVYGFQTLRCTWGPGWFCLWGLDPVEVFRGCFHCVPDSVGDMVVVLGARRRWSFLREGPNGLALLVEVGTLDHLALACTPPPWRWCFPRGLGYGSVRNPCSWLTCSPPLVVCCNLALGVFSKRSAPEHPSAEDETYREVAMMSRLVRLLSSGRVRAGWRRRGGSRGPIASSGSPLSVYVTLGVVSTGTTSDVKVAGTIPGAAVDDVPAGVEGTASAVPAMSTREADISTTAANEDAVYLHK
ncbi:hypothetical protein Taro_029520 [Colocasia esculenta]|uniref:Uncharacterized protein n=1 Tax=Colocasia esculenta TaxID=4460 RepID=A0A843VV34_COLES|nr:hypothetical protein [Colocasia esculenta]